MNIESTNWKLESIQGDQYVMVVQKQFGDNRIVSRSKLPSIEKLKALPEIEFDRVAMGAFMDWNEVEEMSWGKRLQILIQSLTRLLRSRV